MDAIAAGIKRACHDRVTLVIFDAAGRESSRMNYAGGVTS
jgi:hypothetical protein